MCQVQPELRGEMHNPRGKEGKVSQKVTLNWSSEDGRIYQLNIEGHPYKWNDHFKGLGGVENIQKCGMFRMIRV